VACRVRWTELAWNGVESAAEYITRNSPGTRQLCCERPATQLVPSGNSLSGAESFQKKTIRTFANFSFKAIGSFIGCAAIINFIHGARDLAAIVRKR